jgi:uncharacterized protein YegL
MSGFNQVPFGNINLAENPSQRVPCVLVLDTSASMSGEKIDRLNKGLETFANELQADGMASKSAEVAIVTFGPVEVLEDPPFVTADDFFPVTLDAHSATPMGEAVMEAINLCRNRKNELKAAGVPYYRPWIFLITDGVPTDDITAARTEIAKGEKDKSFVFYAVGVEGANMDVLTDLSVREPLKLKGMSFREMFSWLSSSIRAISASQIGDDVPLADPTSGPDGWAVYN